MGEGLTFPRKTSLVSKPEQKSRLDVGVLHQKNNNLNYVYFSFFVGKRLYLINSIEYMRFYPKSILWGPKDHLLPTTALKFSMFRVRLIESSPRHPVPLRFLSILLPRPSLEHPNDFIHTFSPPNPVCVLLLPPAYYVPCPSHPLQIDSRYGV